MTTTIIFFLSKNKINFKTQEIILHMIVGQIQKEYRNKIDSIDLDLIISHVIKKEREFVMAHPEYVVTSNQHLVISKMIARRLKNEPLAYILGEKEFYGLNFKVTPHTLIPRPETELMVEMALEFMKTPLASVIPEVSISERAKRFHGNTAIWDLKEKNRSQISDFSTAHSSQEKSTFWDDTTVIDVGTGSGNIIVSIVHQLKNTNYKPQNTNYFATDISKDTLKTAKQNAKHHNVHKEITFLHGNLLSPFLKYLSAPETGIRNTKYIIQNTHLLILANLPYLSKDIYNACADNVKKYEPKSALYSSDSGLFHYDKLLKQIKLLVTNYQLLITAFLEISPEQKKLLPPLVKKYFPKAKIAFKKDLAQKWRVCEIEI